MGLLSYIKITQENFFNIVLLMQRVPAVWLIFYAQP